MIFCLRDLGQQRETRLQSVAARRPPCCGAYAALPRHNAGTPAPSHGAAVRVRSEDGCHLARSRQGHPDSFSKRRQAWPSGLLEGSACFGPVLSCCDRGSWKLPDVKRLFCLHETGQAGGLRTERRSLTSLALPMGGEPPPQCRQTHVIASVFSSVQQRMTV